MKLVTYLSPEEQQHNRRIEGGERLGFVIGDRVLNLSRTALMYQEATRSPDMGATSHLAQIVDFLSAGEAVSRFAHDVAEWASGQQQILDSARLLDDVRLLAPVPHPPSVRDGYAFRQHVETARRNRGVEMIPEFDEFPVFYFTNHTAVSGPGDVMVRDRHLDRLDYELECAVVIAREGTNIPASKADAYIGGYMIFNDWSARALQMQEMKLNLGPAKGKDFASTFGPWLVTVDELADRRVAGDNGDRYDLEMIARINGRELSRGNLKDMNWTFAQIIERASYGVTLRPGEVIGSGTVGTGCLLELNGSKVTDNLWLKDGDEVELEIDRLGVLKNTVRRVGQ